MRTTKPATAKKRTGPKPRGLLKKTIMMSKAREVAIKRAVAEGRAPSASGYIEQALAAYATLEGYDELLAEWRRDVGPATPEERAWASDAVKKAVGAAERKAG